MRSVTRRAAFVAAGLLPVLLVTSFTPVDDFVRSGAYAEARAALADCRTSFFPAMDEADREPLRFASVIPYIPAGHELRYTYRPLNPNPVDVRSDGEDYEWIDRPEDAHWEIYESPDGAMSMAVSSRETAGGCTRLYMKVVPPVLQVGLRASTVQTEASFLEEFQDLIPADYSGEMPLHAMAPGEGEVVVKFFKDGAPRRSQDIYVSTDPRGVPGRYGATLGHEHIAFASSSSRPSILIRGQRVNGDEVRLRTDSEGESRFWVRAGYRGGAELILARTPREEGSSGLSRAVPVIVRHGEFKNFIFALGYEERPETGNEFPFVLTGWSERHYYNHFIDSRWANAAAELLRMVWSQDKGRIESKNPRYIVLGDMSLEYGGAFKLGTGDACLDSRDGAHQTHDRGIDIDISPCYTTGRDGLEVLSPQDCERGGHLKINERLLAAHVIGRYGGAILVHKPSVDRTPYHYHIHFPGR